MTPDVELMTDPAEIETAHGRVIPVTLYIPGGEQEENENGEQE